MKKIYLFSILFINTCLFAQTSTSFSRGGSGSGDYIPHAQGPSSMPVQLAQGDTLLYMPFPEVSVNLTDLPTFKPDSVEDLDGLTINSTIDNPAGSYPTSWGLLGFEDGARFFLPYQTIGVDTNFFLSATSWFASPGQASNWLSFGPITIPASGAILSWYVANNPYGRDGYELYVGTAGLGYSNFSGAPIYSRTDIIYTASSPTMATDTMFNKVNINIPSTYNGQQLYFGFHHNANDVDQIRIDDILITEQATSIVENFVNGFDLKKISPNPVKDNIIINYEMNQSAAVEFQIMDVAGKVILKKAITDSKVGGNSIFMNVSDLSSGVYYVQLKNTKTEGVSRSQKIIIVK